MSENTYKFKSSKEMKKESEAAIKAGKSIANKIPGIGGKVSKIGYKGSEKILDVLTDVYGSHNDKYNEFLDEALNGDSKVNLGDTIISDNPQPQSTNSQTPTFSPKNLIESEITQINEALGRYGVADKERYLREIDGKMAVFNGYLDNRCDALEKFTKNSDLSAASSDFDKAVKQQENLLKELKEQLSFTEKNAIIRVFASKFHNVKTLENKKERVGVAMPKYYLDIISDYKRQIVRNFGEKTWQETFENFQKTNDLKVFENAVKSQILTQNFNKNINLQISNENANLKNSENNITNPQENGNDFKM